MCGGDGGRGTKGTRRWSESANTHDAISNNPSQQDKSNARQRLAGSRGTDQDRREGGVLRWQSQVVGRRGRNQRSVVQVTTPRQAALNKTKGGTESSEWQKGGRDSTMK